MGSRTGDASSCLIDRGSARRSLRLSRGTRRPQRIQGAYQETWAQRENLALLSGGCAAHKGLRVRSKRSGAGIPVPEPRRRAAVVRCLLSTARSPWVVNVAPRGRSIGSHRLLSRRNAGSHGERTRVPEPFEGLTSSAPAFGARRTGERGCTDVRYRTRLVAAQFGDPRPQRRKPRSP